MRSDETEQLSVSAERVPRGIIDHTGRYGIEMDIGDDLPEIQITVDDACPISTLPKSAQVSVAAIVAARDGSLETGHRSPQVDISSRQDQMEVIPHKAPRENRPTIEVSNVAEYLYELDRLGLIIEDEFTAGDAAVDVVRGSWDKQASVSWHEIAPMRGRDASILPLQAKDATMLRMLRVAPIAGDLANWHPHVHALVSRGGWSVDREWVPVAFVDERSAELLFRHKVIRLLQDEGLLSEERTELLLSWRHTGFSVHNRVRVEPADGAAVERLARSIMRPPISLDRMAWDGVGEVRYRRKRGHACSGLRGREVEAFDAREFLARVLMHVPEPRRHLVRYYGWYSNVSRGKRRKACPEHENLGDAAIAMPSRAARAETRDARALRRSWARLIKRIYEVDPLVCPSCGGEMKVIAFIIEHEVLAGILRHLKRKEKRRERGPPA